MDLPRIIPRYIAVVAAAALVLALLGVPVSGAAAAPSPPPFGPMIDALGAHEGQKTCSATDKPGVRAFRRFVLSQYPDTGAGGISRDCGSGGTSEHKEGRAWDWGVHVDVPEEKAAADELIAWLLAPDEYGNEMAMARRAGIMYLIWNRRIWSVWGGWQTYCEQKQNVGCVKPGTNETRRPHTDHVHFSFTWAGALKKTTFYRPDRSYVSAIDAAASDGYWIAGRNGGIVAFGAPGHGDRAGKTKASPVIDVAATRGGNGYYLLSENGRVSAFGDAVHYGGARRTIDRAAALAPTPSGRGYFVLGSDGKVLAFGDAHHAGDASGSTTEAAEAVDLLVTSGGYRIVTADGRVHAFGAPDLRGAERAGARVVAAATAGDGGFWLLTSDGRVRARGNAVDFGDAQGAPGSPVSLAPTRGGDGLWVVTDVGAVTSLGAAPVLGDLAP